MTFLGKKREQNFSKKYETLWYLELVKVVNFSDKKAGFLVLPNSKKISP